MLRFPDSTDPLLFFEELLGTKISRDVYYLAKRLVTVLQHFRYQSFFSRFLTTNFTKEIFNQPVN